MSYAFQYPSGPLDDPTDLFNQLGTCWSSVYQGNDLVQALCVAKQLMQRQTVMTSQALFASLSRKKIHTFRTENWYELKLLASQVDASTYSQLQYGDAGYFFNDSTTQQYGTPLQTALFAWQLPAGVTSIPQLSNRITGSSVTLFNRVDFNITAGNIIFRDNPFADENIPQTAIFANGIQVDSQISLWAFKAQLDANDLYQQFGYVLGLQLPSSKAYKQLINALYDSLVNGATSGDIRNAFSAITGVPLAVGDEVVEVIDYSDARTLVITDQQVYSFAPSAIVTVSVGQRVKAFDSLTDALQVFEFNHGQTPNSTDIPALVLGRGLLAAGIYGDLVFENKTVPLYVNFDAYGNTQLSWELGGDARDVATFFSQLQARGLSRGRTLANLMDQRPRSAREGEPTAGALPTTINPFQFLCQNVLRNNVFVIKIRSAAAQTGVGMEAAKLMRRVIPPQTVMLLIVELEYSGDVVTMDGAGDNQFPGYTENVTAFAGMSSSETIDPAAYVTEDVHLFQVVGRC